MYGKTENAETKYIANKEYVLREVLGEYMLIPTGKLSMTTNGVITISESAAYLLKKMDEGKTISQLCELLLEEYEVDRETVLSDVNEMVNNMYALNIIEIES